MHARTHARTHARPCADDESSSEPPPVNPDRDGARPKYKVLPRNQYTMVQAITPIPTSSGMLSANCSAMAVMVFTRDHKASTLERSFLRSKYLVALVSRRSCSLSATG